jgi:hypothetical protein
MPKNQRFFEIKTIKIWLKYAEKTKKRVYKIGIEKQNSDKF